jgi:hypothetical protein
VIYLNLTGLKNFSDTKKLMNHVIYLGLIIYGFNPEEEHNHIYIYIYFFFLKYVYIISSCCMYSLFFNNCKYHYSLQTSWSNTACHHLWPGQEIEWMDFFFPWKKQEIGPKPSQRMAQQYHICYKHTTNPHKWELGSIEHQRY